MKKNDFVIVRTYSAGVFAGNLMSRKDKETTLKNVIRLWYWDGAFSLSQLAEKGTNKPENCKFGIPVSEILVTETIEILKVSETGEKSIKGVKSCMK